MTAYFVLRYDWTDDAARARYMEGMRGMVARYGGRFLVAAERAAVLEGGSELSRLVVIEFPSTESLRSWYDSDEYRPLLQLRLRSSRSDAVAAEGVALPSPAQGAGGV